MTLTGFEGRIYFMLDYAICEISGKQYKVTPDKPIEVDLIVGLDKDLEVPVLLLSEGDKVKIGYPYLKDKLTLKYLDNVKGKKIRVAKFHAKANFRNVTGHRVKKTKLVYAVKTAGADLS